MAERLMREAGPLGADALSGSPSRYDVSELRGLEVGAVDGDIGTVEDIYFEDDTWTVRYLVIDTRGWLTGRTVLVSPHAVRGVRLDEGKLDVVLTREQIANSPHIDSDKPVSRQFETAFHGYYGYPYYWTGPYMWGIAPYPHPAEMQEEAARATTDERASRERIEGDPHLRSAKEVTGYYVEAVDGSIGHIETLLLDARSWEINSVVVDTKNWLPGKHVIVRPAAILSIDWSRHQVYLATKREAVEASPEYDA